METYICHLRITASSLNHNRECLPIKVILICREQSLNFTMPVLTLTTKETKDEM